jgi:hypothetical protein
MKEIKTIEKMRFQDQDHQEILETQEIKDRNHDLMIKESKKEIMVLKEIEIIMISMKRIIDNLDLILVMIEIKMIIIMIIEVEITEIRIKEIEDLHRELDFLHSINLYLQKKILKIIKKNPAVKLNENKSGLYINLTFLPESTLQEINEYITYVNVQETMLNPFEKEKTDFKNTYFMEKENKEETTSIYSYVS